MSARYFCVFLLLSSILFFAGNAPGTAQDTTDSSTGSAQSETRGDAFIAAIRSSLEEFKKAVEDEDPSAAESAAVALGAALSVYQAKPTVEEIIARANDLTRLMDGLKPVPDDRELESALEALSGKMDRLQGLGSADFAVFQAERLDRALDAIPQADRGKDTELADELRKLSEKMALHSGIGSAEFAVQQANMLLMSLNAVPKEDRGKDNDLKTALTKLAAEMAWHLGLGTSDFIVSQAGIFETYLARTANAKVDATGLRPLVIKIIEATRYHDAVETAKTMTEVIDSLVKESGAYLPPLGDETFVMEMEKAETLLHENVFVKYPVKSFISAAEAITGLIDDETIKENETAKKEAEKGRRILIMNNPAAMEKAKKAEQAIELLQDGYRPRIHIIEAFYGDVYATTNSARYCDATLTMRTLCERRDKCALQAGYRTKLCGYDPVPAAAAFDRGVAVLFSCHAGGDATWDQLAVHPRQDPDNGSDLSDPNNPAVSGATMRGTEMEIACPFPAYGVSGAK